MTRLLRLLPLLLLLAAGDALTIVKSSAVVSDPQGNLLPRRVPGAVIDYTVTVTNPNGLTTTVNRIAITDAIPAGTTLQVSDLGLLNAGPVVVTPGLSLLGYAFTALDSTTDQLDFSSDNGASWSYAPVPDKDGYDAAVTNIRVRLSGSQLAGSAFSIRFRVRVN